MNILTINPGSTSVKYSVFNKDGDILSSKEFSRKEYPYMQDDERKWIGALSDIAKIGIRIVHGGNVSKSGILDTEAVDEIKRATDYAPIHNKIALDIISELYKIFEHRFIVAVYDTEFHSELPEYAYTYPIPSALSQELGVRRLGFHGIALRSVLDKLPYVSAERGTPMPRKIIMAHLGGGSSVTAVRDGISVDTTMGFTPLEGIMMITRSGSLDPDIFRIISKEKFLNIKEVSEILNEQSGFFGLTGSKDTVDIFARAEQKEEPYKLAVDIFVHQLVKQIFAYYGILQGADALVFSGGIGFGNVYLRNRIIEKTKIIGLNNENTFAIEANEAKTIFKITNETD